MTKIKNTKKGMAKKTLSVSLAVAMLATSNVPVWAAEFSDGSEAAFTAEVDAPVVEDNTEDVPEAQAIGDVWTVKADMPATVEWGNNQKVAVEFTQTGVEESEAKYTTLKSVWRDAETELAIDSVSSVTGKTVNVSLPKEKTYVGKSFKLLIWDESGDWEYTSPAVTVTKKDITDLVNISAITGSTDYTGEEVKPSITIDAGTSGLTDSDFNIDYTGDPDLINKGSVVTITVTAVNTDYYSGKVTKDFTIGAKTASIDDFEMSYINGTYEYTGNIVTPKASDIRVSEVNGTVVDGAVTSVTPASGTKADVGEYTASATVDLTKFKNYSGSVTEAITGKYSVVARDLGNCTVTVPAMASTGSKAVVDPSNITVTDAEGNVLNLKNDIKIDVPAEATASGTYTVTISPKDGKKNVVGSTTATLVLYAKNIADVAKLDATAIAELNKVAYFTGSQITKDTSKFIGHVLNKTDGNKVLDTNQYTVEFGTNINAGTKAGIVKIVGKNTYEGSVAEFKFDITAASIDKVEPEEVVYIENAKAEDYAPSIVITAKNGDNKTWTLTEGTDYTITSYEFATINEVGDDKLIANLAFTKDAQTNYGVSATEQIGIDIVYPSLTSANIKMEKVSYEYTGAAIVPEYKVYDGDKELKANVDYVVVNTIGGKDVGTATLVITGATGSKYNPKVNATATFEITPTSAEKVEVKLENTYDNTYSGTQKKPGLADITVTLNGNNVESQFDITSYGENINAGKEAGTLVLTPKKDNKNFTSTKTAVFEIKQKALTGELNIYDEKGIKLTTLPAFDYDGTEKTFAKAIFTSTDKYVTANDYEIKYVNNVTGNESAILVVAKGNYKAASPIAVKDHTTNKDVENVFIKKEFTINSKLYFTDKEVNVTNPEYAEGVFVKPSIVVTDGSKTLVEGKDYTVTLNPTSGRVAPGETGTWKVTGIGVYKNVTTNKNQASGKWEVTKKDVANLKIDVKLNEKGEVVLEAMNGNIKVDNKNFDVKLSEDKKTVTISATTGNKNYIGSTEVELPQKFPVGKAIIENVDVTGNTVAVKLAGEVENLVGDGDVGYDYVISKSSDCLNRVDRVKVNKTLPTTDTTFYYLEPGTYYAYCHAWTRDEDGMKAFGEWSNVVEFKVTAVTPERPQITSVKISGNTVTVTYTECEGAEGYDIVLGSTLGTDAAGYKRPYDYGKLVKKNVKAGTTTVTFKNVESGTYYVGLHAWSKEDGKKVFSKWSNIVTRTVK